MPRKLKVYGWQCRRSECPMRHRQTREIVAAQSMAEVARLTGVNSPRQLFNLCETGNKEEIAAAMSKPMTIFWAPINDVSGRYVEDGQAWQE